MKTNTVCSYLSGRGHLDTHALSDRLDSARGRLQESREKLCRVSGYATRALPPAIQKKVDRINRLMLEVGYEMGTAKIEAIALEDAACAPDVVNAHDDGCNVGTLQGVGLSQVRVSEYAPRFAAQESIRCAAVAT